MINDIIFHYEKVNPFNNNFKDRVMKKIFIFCLIFIPTIFLFAGGISKSDCTYKGKKLYGKIKLVTSFPDIKVQVVSSFPDLKVQKVTSFPNSCGKWQIVESFPDLKVQIVNSFPDVKIKYVSSFPGF